MPRAYCPRCQRPDSYCLCSLIPCLPSRTRVLILQHPSETRHALNTARLAALSLENAELRIGEQFADPSIVDPSSYLLFPGPEAVPLAELAGSARPLRLIVPDGTWRKARKLLYLNPALAALPRVSLPEGAVSRYRLRKASIPGALSTLEAIVTALNLLEGTGRFDALLKPFDALIDGQIRAMGENIFRRNHDFQR
ncbi:tRNA-uridine aminocarboxypropyltransferase [Azomonas macrocytogenes]|uniref:tRNA-uridine aminocarboxypropyltransferase n=1 Tax=Azomonas macrocytogenes TaxID=69962 RepID=A0A839T7N1_AZOMA|nr:DTW domain-containing protein [Azomonas macrocytogenes]MBB3104860.1 DTW domain-containing protein YfiP [Azomonas macrocytogenes]